MKFINFTFLSIICSLLFGINVSASNLNKYFVSDVLDNSDKIIVQDQFGNDYLVEYGIGCLNMWKEESNYIYIDIGGSYLDGIGDTIYINDLKDDCIVWEVNELNKYSSNVSGPAPFASLCVKGNTYYLADNVKYYDEHCIIPYNPSWNLKWKELYNQTCPNGGTLNEKQLVNIILDSGNGSVNTMSEICKNNQEKNKALDKLIKKIENGFCRKYNNDEILFTKNLLKEKGLQKTWRYKLTEHLYLGNSNGEAMNSYYDNKCTLKYDSSVTNYITENIELNCYRDATISELIDWGAKLKSNNSLTNYNKFSGYLRNKCNNEINEEFLVQNIDEKLTNRLKGRILLQVENHGEAWYVNPSNGQRSYMANGDEAYNIMRKYGIGITNNDLKKIKIDSTIAKKYSGKIFLQVEAHGEAYYIDFNGVAHYLENGKAAYTIMRNLGLGITNNNLNKILIN